jgi:protein gp37
MADRTAIEWADATWNFATGCRPVSAGCSHCYAASFAGRFAAPGERWEGLTERDRFGIKWTGAVKVAADKLADPLRWRKPRDVFPCSMSDLGYEGLGADLVAAAFGVMAAARDHRFLVLTKRPQRLAVRIAGFGPEPLEHCMAAARDYGIPIAQPTLLETEPPAWPLENVLIGVTVEDQLVAADRLDTLVALPAAGRFVSCEPLIATVDLAPWLDRLDWVIVGGESGRKARPMAVSWAARIVADCEAAAVPCFVKQLGADWALRSGYRDDAKGKRLDRWPPEVCRQQRPTVGRRITT